MQPTNRRSVSGCSSSNLLVLLADDNAINREAASALLSLWGIEPLIACDGMEAVRLACERELDIVLMDLDMPRMNGLSATAEIRRFERQNPSRLRVPVIAYSSDDLSRLPGGLLSTGFSGVLPKPSDSLSMSDCLRHWCGDRFSRLGHATLPGAFSM